MWKISHLTYFNMDSQRVVDITQLPYKEKGVCQLTTALFSYCSHSAHALDENFFIFYAEKIMTFWASHPIFRTM